MIKNFIAFVSAAALLCACGPAKLVMDSRTEDGERILLTSDSRIFGNVEMALGAKVDPKDTVLAILVTYDGKSDHGVFDVNDRLLFKLSDGEVISLQNVYDREYSRENEVYTTNDRVSGLGYAYAYDPFYDVTYVSPVEVNSFIPRTHTRTVTESYALYLITRNQLNDIISKGLVKLRVEIENDELDMTGGTKSVSTVLADQYNCLRNAFANPHRRSEF